jgi:hypothetical protein
MGGTVEEEMEVLKMVVELVTDELRKSGVVSLVDGMAGGH